MNKNVRNILPLAKKHVTLDAKYSGRQNDARTLQAKGRKMAGIINSGAGYNGTAIGRAIARAEKDLPGNPTGCTAHAEHCSAPLSPHNSYLEVQ